MALSLSSIYQSKTARTVAVFASGNTVAMVLGVIGSLVQARYIGPEDMGVFRTFGIVAGYLTFLHLGVFDGLGREIPLQLGRGNQAKAEQAASACLAWIMFLSLSCWAIFLGLALRAASYGEWMQFWGWLAYSLFIVATFYGGYLGMTFRTGQQFIALSKTSVIHAISGTLVLPLLPIMGYYGVCLRTAVGSATNMFFLHCWRPLRVRPRLDWPSFREVVRIGLPLSGAGYLATSLWVSLEGTFMLEWFRIDDRWQKSEVGGPRAETTGKEVRGRRSEVRDQRSEKDRGRRSEVGGQKKKTEVRGRKRPEVRDRKAEIRSQRAEKTGGRRLVVIRSCSISESV